MIKVLPAGAAKRKTLDAVRAELTKVNDELESIADSVRLADDAAERTLQQALELIEQNRATLSSGFRHHVPFSLEHAGGLPLLLGALLDPKELRARLMAMYKSDGLPEGLSVQDRANRRQALTARRAKLLVDEEIATRDLEAAGFVVERNAEPDPELLLRVWETCA